MGTLAVGQALRVHQALHAQVAGADIDAASGEQVLQRASFRRRFRMQREMHEVDVDFVGACEFFNTPGTEITPRSDVVGEHIEDEPIVHRRAPFGWGSRGHCRVREPSRKLQQSVFIKLKGRMFLAAI